MQKSIHYSKKYFLFTGFAFLLFLSSLYAEKANGNEIENAKAKVLGMIHMIFKDSDKNHDGQANKEETKVLKAKLKDFYTKFFTLVQKDKNGNEKVFAPPAKQINEFVDKIFNALDTEKKGELSKEKFIQLKIEVEKIVLSN